MLTQLYRLLCAQVSAAGLPVYQADCVPPDADFPYITMLAEPNPSFGGRGKVTLTVWHRSGTPHADRLAQADAVMAAVPCAGLPLWLDCGLAVLYRARDAQAVPCSSKAAQGFSLHFDLLTYPSRPITP